jgi:hypothetical protein
VTTAFNVLFDVLSAYKARVWDLDIAAAIRGLLNQIRAGGYIDFERSGVALLSSAIIFRRKTEELLKLEEPPKPPVDNKQSVVYDRLVLPIDLPVRTAHPVVDSTELFSDLVELLTKALRERKLFVGSTEVAEDLTERIVDLLADAEDGATAEMLAKQLGVSVERARAELDELSALGLVSRSGRGADRRWWLG